MTDIKHKEFESQTSYESSRDEHTPPPPPYSKLAGHQVFEVHYNEWKSHIYIRDDRGTQLFTAIRERASPRVEVTDRNGNMVGKSKASSMTTKITVELFNTAGSQQVFELHNHATVGSPRYNSPAFGGQQLTWKNKMLSRKILYDLTDDSGKLYVKFESDPKTKIGRLDVSEECMSEDRLNEIVVTLLSLLVRKLRNANDMPQYGIVS